MIFGNGIASNRITYCNFIKQYPSYVSHKETSDNVPELSEFRMWVVCVGRKRNNCSDP